MIIGQEKLIEELTSYSIDTFPKALMLIGEYGSGKHMISKHIADHFGLPLIDINEQISLDKSNRVTLSEMIDKITLTVSPSFYLLDTYTITEKDQNTILKFLEEPLNNAFIILLVNNKEKLLTTISNRCQQFRLAPYSKEILSEFIETGVNNSLILDIVKTPGEAKEIKGDKLLDIINLSEKIIECMSKASFANMLTILDKVSFRAKKNAVVEKEEEKIDAFILCRVLLKKLRDKIVASTSQWYYSAYDLTLVLSRKLSDSITNLGIDQKYLFAQYLTDMWNKSREVLNEK